MEKINTKIGWLKTSNHKKEVLQEMELISYYSEDFFPRLSWVEKITN